MNDRTSTTTAAVASDMIDNMIAVFPEIGHKSATEVRDMKKAWSDLFEKSGLPPALLRDAYDQYVNMGHHHAPNAGEIVFLAREAEEWAINVGLVEDASRKDERPHRTLTSEERAEAFDRMGLVQP